MIDVKKKQLIKTLLEHDKIIRIPSLRAASAVSGRGW
jgi:hypothetical protein